MIDVDPLLLEAITGSFEPFVQVDAWYNGALTYENLPVAIDGSVKVDAGNMIERTCDLEVISDDPQLDPDWIGPGRELSPIGCDGQELNIRMGITLPGGESVSTSVGWFVIDSVDPSDTWVQYPSLGKSVLSGLSVRITGQDRALKQADNRFLTEIGTSSTTVHGELFNLIRDVGLVGRHLIDDRALSWRVYETDERLTAIDEVAKTVNGRVRWDVDGLAVLRRREWNGGAWGIPEGSSDLLVSSSRKRTRDEIYNAVVSEGADNNQNPIYGISTERSGPYRWDGPFGRKVYKRNANFAKSQSSIASDSQTTLGNITKKRQMEVRIECPFNPALESLDSIAYTAGSGKRMVGLAQDFTLNFNGTMELTVLTPHPIASAVW